MGTGRGQISPERELEIAELAEEVADWYSPSTRVDPVAIIKSKGITLVTGWYADAFDGLLEYHSGRFYIYSNLDRVEDLKAPRAKFTLGHELGHWFIDEHRNALEEGLAPSHPSFCDYTSDHLIEREADWFASNLLMPRKRFLKVAMRSPRGMAGILFLADTFRTSVTSTAIRYVTEEVEPCALIKWQDGRFKWPWLSAETRKVGLLRTVRSSRNLEAGSPTARALAGERPVGRYFSETTTVGSWFPKVDVTQGRNMPLVEQAIPLGRFGVLTLLYPQFGSYNPIH